MDQMEAMEAAAEIRYDEMDQGNGKLKCSCGKLFDLGEGGVPSINPYAMPVCNECFEGAMKSLKKEEE